MPALKIIFLGASGTGKTSMIASFLYGTPSIPSKPVLFGAYTKEIKVFNEEYRLNICDTTGQNEFTRLHEMSFLDADVLVICVDQSDRSTLKRIEEYKKEKIKKVLCLTKNDKEKKITQEEIEECLNKYKMIGATSCSSNDNESVRRSFEEIVEMAVKKGVINNGCCNIFGYKCC